MDDKADDINQALLHDLDPEIIEFLAKRLAWEYDGSYERLKQDNHLTDGERQERYSDDRGACAVRAMEHTAERFGIPKEVLRLPCNGQHKVMLKIGRLILIQETMQTRFDDPQVAAYKVKLARMHGIVRQLEFDFGDGYFRPQEWSGCHLGVLLHAPVGPKFTRDHKMLGALMLGLPDALYQSWVRRIDLYEVAMYGLSGEAPPPAPSTRYDNLPQEDRVVVTLKRRNSRRNESQ